MTNRYEVRFVPTPEPVAVPVVHEGGRTETMMVASEAEPGYRVWDNQNGTWATAEPKPLERAAGLAADFERTMPWWHEPSIQAAS